MSLQYVIDGYNITNHPRFIRHATKTIKDNRPSRAALLEFIRLNRLCGSPRNKITVVFDGYPDSSWEGKDADIRVIFSRQDSADERIRKILEGLRGARNIVVVSGDKEIKSFAKIYGAKAMSVEDFIPLETKKAKVGEDAIKPELNYSQMHKINEELSKLWLK